MPAAYQSAPVVVCQRFHAGTATTLTAPSIIPAWRSCPHIRMPWKTV